MDKIEDVKKDIEEALISYAGDVLNINKKYPIGEGGGDRVYALNTAREKRLSQICQLFEHPEYNTSVSSLTAPNKPNPEKGWLLRNEETIAKWLFRRDIGTTSDTAWDYIDTEVHLKYIADANKLLAFVKEAG